LLAEAWPYCAVGVAGVCASASPVLNTRAVAAAPTMTCRFMSCNPVQVSFPRKSGGAAVWKNALLLGSAGSPIRQVQRYQIQGIGHAGSTDARRARRSSAGAGRADALSGAAALRGGPLFLPAGRILIGTNGRALDRQGHSSGILIRPGPSRSASAADPRHRTASARRPGAENHPQAVSPPCSAAGAPLGACRERPFPVRQQQTIAASAAGPKLECGNGSFATLPQMPIMNTR
jgi:hypothetical protein